MEWWYNLLALSSLNRRTIFHSRAQRLLNGPVVVDLDEYGFTSARRSLALRCLLRGYHSRAGIYPSSYLRYCRCQRLIRSKWCSLTPKLAPLCFMVTSPTIYWNITLSASKQGLFFPNEISLKRLVSGLRSQTLCKLGGMCGSIRATVALVHSACQCD